MARERTAAELLDAGDEALVEGGFCTGDFTEARGLLNAARARAAGDGDEDLEAASADRLGMVRHYVNITSLMAGMELDPRDVTEEEELFRHALAVREQQGDLAGRAQSMFGLAANPLRAVELLGRAVTIARAARLLAVRVQEAEQVYREAEAALAAQR